MAVEVKYDKSHHAGATPEARIANRLRNSGDHRHADHVANHGSGPNRTFTNIVHAPNYNFPREDESRDAEKNQPRDVPNKGMPVR